MRFGRRRQAVYGIEDADTAFNGVIKAEDDLGGRAQGDALVERLLNGTTVFVKVLDDVGVTLFGAEDADIDEALLQVHGGLGIMNGENAVFETEIALEDHAELAFDKLADALDAEGHGEEMRGRWAARRRGGRHE